MAVFSKLFDKAVYQFSRANVSKLLSNKTFYPIFLHYLDKGDFETVLRSDQTMCDNPEPYQRMANDFITEMKANGN